MALFSREKELRRCGLAVTALTLLSWGLPRARADDGSGIGVVGGAVKLMRGHPSVRMVSEVVRIKLPACQVQARFVFHNEGPSVSTLMCFPELAGGPDPAYTHYTNLEHFRSYVDGHPVHVRRVVVEKGDEDDQEYAYWWVKKVDFAPGQTRVVVNRYTGGLGNAGYGENPFFTYILRTGATWKGPIGRAQILCETHGLGESGPLRITPPGYKRSGDIISWDFRNIKPTQDIRVQWFEGALLPEQVLVAHQDTTANSSLRPRPYRRGPEAWIPVSTIAIWLGASLKKTDGGRTWQLRRGPRWVKVTLGSPWLGTSTGRIRMTRSAYKQDGYTIAALRPILREFGGNAVFDEDGNLRIEMQAGRKPL